MDYVKTAAELDKISDQLQALEESMVPSDTMKLFDAYIMGHLKSCRLLVSETSKAIRTSNSYKKRRKRIENEGK